AFHISVEHFVEVLKERMVTGKFRKPTVTEIVLRGRSAPIISLESTHQVFRVMRQQSGLLCVVIEILLKRLVAFPRHRQIAGENVVKRWNISRALDRSMTAQCENSAAGPADVTKEQLQNRRGTNDLHALRMLRPTYRIADRSCSLRPGCSSKRVRDLVKQVGGNTADFLHHLRRVTGEMPFQFW